MKKSSELTQVALDDLLAWFSPDREVAGESYLRIRTGLERFFRLKGCHDPESLVDETINRVALRLKELDFSTDHKHATYFYGFAKNVFFEYLAELRRTPVQLEPDLVPIKDRNDPDPQTDCRFDCLESCLAKLDAEDSVMVLSYFEKDRREKIEARRRLAEALNISIGNLHIRIFRLKLVLRKCVDKCLNAA